MRAIPVRDPDAAVRTEGREPRMRVLRWMLAGAAIAVAAVVVLWTASRPAQPDAFYDPPAQKPGEPGTLLRSEAYTTQLPAGARGWRILYATKRADDSAAVASAVVIASAQATGAPRPVIAWAHGTTGAAHRTQLIASADMRSTVRTRSPSRQGRNPPTAPVVPAACGSWRCRSCSPCR